MLFREPQKGEYVGHCLPILVLQRRWRNVKRAQEGVRGWRLALVQYHSEPRFDAVK